MEQQADSTGSVHLGDDCVVEVRGDGAPALSGVALRKTRDVAGILHFLTPQQMAEEIVRLDTDAARYRWLTRHAYIGECFTDEGTILEVHNTDRRVPIRGSVHEAIDAAIAAPSTADNASPIPNQQSVTSAGESA